MCRAAQRILRRPSSASARSATSYVMMVSLHAVSRSVDGSVRSSHARRLPCCDRQSRCCLRASQSSQSVPRSAPPPAVPTVSETWTAPGRGAQCQPRAPRTASARAGFALVTAWQCASGRERADQRLAAVGQQHDQLGRRVPAELATGRPGGAPSPGSPGPWRRVDRAQQCVVAAGEPDQDVAAGPRRSGRGRGPARWSDRAHPEVVCRIGAPHLGQRRCQRRQHRLLIGTGLRQEPLRALGRYRGGSPGWTSASPRLVSRSSVS